MDGSSGLAKPGNGDAIRHQLLRMGRMVPASRSGSALIGLIEIASVIGMQHTTTDQCVCHLPHRRRKIEARAKEKSDKKLIAIA
jgi:hypothetical protein